MRTLIVIIFALVAVANALWFGCLTIDALFRWRIPIEASQRGTYGQAVGFFTSGGFVLGGWLWERAKQDMSSSGSLAILALLSVMLAILGGIMRFTGHDLSPAVIGPYHPFFDVGWCLGFALGGASLPMIWTNK